MHALYRANAIDIEILYSGVTYRVSSSRSSLTSSGFISSSPSSSELMARARRAFKGIRSVDWKRLSHKNKQNFIIREQGSEISNLQLVLIHGILG